jgi:putative chitinase
MSTIQITVEQLKYISGGYGRADILEGLCKYLPQYLPGY